MSDIEFLEAVCERMQQVGLVQSKADFSARMLGKGPSYLTSMSARDRKVPDEVIVHLVGQIQGGLVGDDAVLAGLQEETQRCLRDRKHRVDMLEWIVRHQSTEPVRDEPRQRPSEKSLSVIGKLLSRFGRRSAVMA